MMIGVPITFLVVNQSLDSMDAGFTLLYKSHHGHPWPRIFVRFNTSENAGDVFDGIEFGGRHFKHNKMECGRTYRKFRTISLDFFPALSTLRLIQCNDLCSNFVFFFFKLPVNVLGAAYN